MQNKKDMVEIFKTGSTGMTKDYGMDVIDDFSEDQCSNCGSMTTLIDLEFGLCQICVSDLKFNDRW